MAYERVPDRTWLRRHMNKYTQQQMADLWYDETGERVTRQAIAMKISRENLKSKRARPRYEEMLPPGVKAIHKDRHIGNMLRLEARRRRGAAVLPMDDPRRKPGDLLPVQEARRKGFIAQLQQMDAVVVYEPETDEGFFLVPRGDEDDDIIRRPKVKQPAAKKRQDYDLAARRTRRKGR